MRSHLEFRSSELFDSEPDEGAPHGETVANLLAGQLPSHSFQIEQVSPEDWGWRVQVANDAFPLWIGCGHYEEYADGHLCFIEPSKPYVRRWLKRIDTVAIIERLATAMEQVIQDSGKAHDLKWWSEAETKLGQ